MPPKVKPNRRGKGLYIYFSPETAAQLRKVSTSRLVPVTRLVEFCVERVLDELETRGAVSSLGLDPAGAARELGAGAARELAGVGATHDDERLLESLPLPFAAAASSSVSPPPASSRAAPTLPAAPKVSRCRRGAVKNS